MQAAYCDKSVHANQILLNRHVKESLVPRPISRCHMSIHTTIKVLNFQKRKKNRGISLQVAYCNKCVQSDTAEPSCQRVSGTKANLSLSHEQLQISRDLMSCSLLQEPGRSIKGPHQTDKARDKLPRLISNLSDNEAQRELI